MIKSQITYFGEPGILACDGKCNKAWGIDRPKEQLSDNPDDFVFLADQELGDAPACNGHWEGGHGKPESATHNKWCVRQCERSELVGEDESIELPDFSKRQYNMPWLHGQTPNSAPSDPGT